MRLISWISTLAACALAVTGCTPAGPPPTPSTPALTQVLDADASFRAGITDALASALTAVRPDAAPADAGEASVDARFVVTTSSDGAVLANALLADLTEFDGAEALLDRDLLLALHAAADGHTTAAIGGLSRIRVDGTSSWTMQWSGADGSTSRVPAVVEETERDVALGGARIKVRLTAKLKNPPEVNIEIEWSKDQGTKTGFTRIVAPLPDHPTDVDPRDLATAFRSTLTSICCGRPKPGTVRPGALAAASAPDLTVLAVPYQISNVTNENDLTNRDVAFLMLDHRLKGPSGSTCVADDPAAWCRPVDDPFLNLRLVPGGDGGLIAQLTEPTDPTSVVAEGAASVEPRAAGTPDGTTVDVDQTPEAIVITITITVGDLTIVIRIEI